jgi:hypothetical protein
MHPALGACGSPRYASLTALPRPPLPPRWPEGPQSEDAEHVQGSSWKSLYVERDQQAVLEAQRQAPSEAMLPIYLQASTRSGRCSRCTAPAVCAPCGRRRLQLAWSHSCAAKRASGSVEELLVTTPPLPTMPRARRWRQRGAPSR